MPYGFRVQERSTTPSRARGAYAKSLARRQTIVDAALTVIARDGYSAATLKQIADEAGLSQNGLLHHFGSKEQLFVAVLRRRDELDEQRTPDARARLAAIAAGGTDDGATLDTLRSSIVALVEHNADVAGLIHMFIRLTADATDPEHEAHPHIAERYEGLRTLGTTAMRALQSVGEVRTDVSAEHLATMLFALLDGLQNQWAFDPELDMASHADAFVTLLRPQRASEEPA